MALPPMEAQSKEELDDSQLSVLYGAPQLRVLVERLEQEADKGLDVMPVNNIEELGMSALYWRAQRDLILRIDELVQAAYSRTKEKNNG